MNRAISGAKRVRAALVLGAAMAAAGLPPDSRGEGRPIPAAAAAERPGAVWMLAPRTAPLEALASAVAAWTAAAMGVSGPVDAPAIGVLDQRALRALRDRHRGGAGGHSAERIVALYDDDRRTIHLPADWTGATPAEISMLVHEMVHHIQNQTGRRFDCPAAREAQAYDVQDRWLAQYGTSIEAEFELNALARVLLTRCGPPQRALARRGP